jgi:imidazole glycerol-phosphate synthase subunit HisF
MNTSSSTPLNTLLCRRIIPCLDVNSEGRTVKGIQFQGLRDIGDPIELAMAYQDQGADELVFLDIEASHKKRDTIFHVVEAVAKRLMIPFTVGGGISSMDHVKRLLNCGADKVSVNTAAIQNPDLINAIANECGSQCCVLAIDARRRLKPAEEKEDVTLDEIEWDVLIHGGRTVTGLEALDWATQAVKRGAGEILLTSWDRDGTGIGFDIELNRSLSTQLPVPIIASGGASGPESFVDVFKEGQADAALAASIFHDGHWTVSALKAALQQQGIVVRLP